MSTNFGKDILKTERLFQLDVGGCERASDRVSEWPSEWGCDNPRYIARQLAKASGWAKNYFNFFCHEDFALPLETQIEAFLVISYQISVDMVVFNYGAD